MSASNPTVVSRITSAAEVLGCTSEELTKVLALQGIPENALGLKLLDANTTTEEELTGLLKAKLGGTDITAKAAAAILKGNDPFAKAPEMPPFEPKPVAESVSGTTNAEVLVKYLQGTRPIQQLKDRELLELYIAERDYEVEQELHHRAKYQNFVILQSGKHEPGKEVIDIEATMDLLRASRRRTNPTMIPIGETVVPVYRITELNPEGRLVELCPICGDILYKGYCDKCGLDFKSVSDDARAYARLVVDSGKFEKGSHSDCLALWRSATKGVEDLRITWPSLQKVFDERKLTGDLPKLRVMENRPSSQVADPFHVSGNRKY